jgi:hypothetical protein
MCAQLSQCQVWHHSQLLVLGKQGLQSSLPLPSYLYFMKFLFIYLSETACGFFLSFFFFFFVPVVS